jgi:cytochrome o ubiquinol oxidase operon protein cyoD
MNPKKYFEDIGAWPRHTEVGVWSYAVGFVLCLGLTLAAYVLATHATGMVPGVVLVLLGVLACVQFVVQVVYFLHLAEKGASHERLLMLCLAGVVVAILVGGSVWIMLSLNGRMMPDQQQMEHYMQAQQGI